MKNYTHQILLLLFAYAAVNAQQIDFPDPCGIPDTTSMEYRLAASGNWGYGYDTLLYELDEWKKSPFVTIDSVGASVQGRTLFTVTIQDTTADTLNQRQRVWIHARTHPSEVQSTWVTNEIIKLLLADTVIGGAMRQRYIFHIMPMYNPDGVELGYARQNANMIDIESNWNAQSPQKEVLVLRSQFQKYTAMPNPMKIMLNMHSAFVCKRYFVYHAPGGTSMLFSLLEQRFINNVRKHFPGAIEPHTYFVSWINAPATQYPESWCWSNHKEKIMALTYEDGNCEAARAFDSTARAIVLGIDEYLQDTTSVTTVFASRTLPAEFRLEQNFPNPFNPSTTIIYQLQRRERVTLRVIDLLGREVALLVNQEQPEGEYSASFNASELSSGVYIYRITVGQTSTAKTMQLVK